MGQETSYYDITHGTIEEMKKELLSKDFVFRPGYYECWDYNNYPNPVSFKIHYHKFSYENDDIVFSNLEKLLNYLYKRGNNAEKFYEKDRKEEEFRKVFLPRIKNLTNLGFAPHDNYNKYTYEELKTKVETAERKQQEYIEHVFRLGKYIKEKEENRAAQDVDQEIVVVEGNPLL